MKRFLLLTTSVLTGFGVAVLTPLGELGSFDRVQGLVSKINPLATLEEQTTEGLAALNTLNSLGDFQSLIGSAGIEPTGNILQNEEIVMAAGFIDPESAWAMNFAEMERPDGLTNASLSNDIVAPEEMKRGEAGGGNIGQSAPNLAMEDGEVWFSRISEMEIGRLNATIAEIKSENAIILENLKKTEKTHPDYHMSLCIHESNDGLIAFYSFLVKMGQEGASVADTTALAEALAGERSQTLKHIRNGRTTAAAYRSVLESLPANSKDEEKIKAVALEYYDSFVLSFEVEETLATHLTNYPGLIATAIQTGEPPFGVSSWVGDFQELGRSRMELQAFRQSITDQLSGPTA